jgi:hypothetical protein
MLFFKLLLLFRQIYPKSKNIKKPVKTYLFLSGQKSELSNLLREDLKEVTEWEFTLSNPRLEREGE